MPIQVTCSCGKSVAAPSKLAGKKVKCPGCKEPLQVPSANGKASGKSASGKSKNGKSATNGSSAAIKASCSCGKSFKASAKAAGKKVRCPACKEPVTIPSGKKSGKKSAAKVAAAASAPSADDGVGSLLDEVGFQRSGGAGRCPNCKEDLLEEAVLCVACGYNLDTGKMLKSKVKRADEIEDDDGKAPDHVASAEPGKKGGSKMILLLVLLLVLAGAAAFRLKLIPGL